jgi:CelD/BcsL family acetyltransferase involved in cellulose biosynthesis
MSGPHDNAPNSTDRAATRSRRGGASISDVDVELIRPNQLTTEHLNTWTMLLRAAQSRPNPYLTTEWVLAVSAVLDNVEVAVLSSAGEPVGFFPFERRPGGLGVPPAGRLTDGEGIVVASGVRWDARRLIKACGLRNWSFNHVPADIEPFRPFHTEVLPSAHLDLGDGFDAYCRHRTAAGTRLLKQAQRKQRKLGREHGPVRFELHATAPDAADNLAAWKSAALRGQGYRDPFGEESWIVPLLGTLDKFRSDDFASVLSALYSGEIMVAAHWGLRAGPLLVSGVPAHNPAFSQYSPGLLLTQHLARHAAEAGVRDLELGLGLNQMKRSLMTHTTPLAAGIVDVTLPRTRRLYRRARTIARRLGRPGFG